jgi:nucleoside-diphosphate-sugar epimerase
MAAAEEKKPNVLVLGGCGFIGRNFVKFLVDNKLAESIRVVDKNLPAIAYLSAEHKKAFDEKSVQFIQGDLTRDDHVAKAYKDVKFDYVINLCGETRFGLMEEEYKKKCLESAVKCAKAAVENKVKKFVEVSTGQIYEPGDRPVGEEGKMGPWTVLAKYRLEAEKELAKIAGLPLVIVRPAYVYGPGDLTSITPRIVCAAVYQDRKEKMKFLWEKTLKLNTVHVLDVCAALWHCATKSSAGAVYNLADESGADQGTVNGFLGEIFGIEIGFMGSMVSQLAKLNLSAVAEEANDKHVPGWTELCKKHNITNTPLSPYIDKELLKNNGMNIDGSAITRAGFRYAHPRLTKEALQAVVESYIAQGIFPPVLKRKE